MSGASLPFTQRPGLLWWVMACALAVTLLIPLATVEIPPLLDYPNHLARMYVLAHPADGFLAQVYARHWNIIPNIAIDAVMPEMLAFMPLYTAGKIVLAATLLLPVAGTVAYSRATLGVRSLWSLGAGLVAYNFLFLLGFMNFLIGIGAALLAAAVWVSLRRTHPLRAVLILAPAAVLLFFVHIFALALFGLLIGSEELMELIGHRRDGRPVLGLLLRRGAAMAAMFAAPAMLYAKSNLAAVGGGTGWQPLHWKLAWLFDGFLQYHLLPDLGTALVVILTMRTLSRRGQALISPAAMLSLAVLIGLYPFVPFIMKGTAFIDARLPVMAAFLLFAGFAPRGLSRRTGLTLTAALSLIFVLRMASLTQIWQGQNADVAQLRQVIARVKPGSRVLVVTAWGDATQPEWRDMPPQRMTAGGTVTFMHLPALLVTERDSIWPLMFTDQSKQPISVRPAFLGVTASEGMTPDYRLLADDAPPPPGSPQTAPYFADWPDKFDDVLVLNAAGAGDLARIRPDRLTLIDRTDFAALLRVHPAAAPATLAESAVPPAR